MEDLKFNSVNVDVKALREQYENSKKPKNDFQNLKKLSFDPKNYLNLKLKENEREKTVKVRFLPITATDSTYFFPIITHSLKVNKEIANSGFKSYVCLNDEKTESDEECPICKKSNELFEKSAQARREGNEALSKSLYKEACSLKKKTTYITRVIDREHEDEGVKFWRFNENSQGNGIYDILNDLDKTRAKEALEEGEDGYSIFDLYKGKDIIINVNKSQIPDGFGGMKDKMSYNITDGGNRKPLSKDVEKANAWLNDEKTWKDVYSLKSADYLDLVVNGKVPVFDRELGKYVEKKEGEEKARREEEKVATEILKENFNKSADNGEKIGLVNFNVDNSNFEDEELPF